MMRYYAVHREAPDKELTHWKYIKKKKVNGKWRYYYDKSAVKKDIKDTGKKLTKAVKKGKSAVRKLLNRNSNSKMTISNKTLGKLAKKPKYVEKVKMPNGKYRYFYTAYEYNAYLRRLQYQKNEPDFLKKVKKIDKNKHLSADDDMAATNPKYDPYNKDYSYNCFRCSVAYELRRRGYDVTASKYRWGGIEQNLDDFPSIYKNPKLKTIESDGTIRKSTKRDGMTNSNVYAYTGDTLQQALEKDNPPNSRGTISLRWKGGGGHSIVYEINDKGKAKLRDAQTNETYNFDEIADNITRMTYLRTDNLELKRGALKYVYR